MLKKRVKYETYDGDQVEEDFYFNLSKPELFEMEVKYERGFGKVLRDIVEQKDNKKLLEQFKEILLASYGKKSEDGKRFIKSPEIREELAQSAAYETLFMELLADDDKAIDFFKGVLPKDLAANIDADKPKQPTS